MKKGDTVQVHTHWVRNLVGFRGEVTGFNGDWIELRAVNDGLPIFTKETGKTKKVLSWRVGNKLSVRESQLSLNTK